MRLHVPRTTKEKTANTAHPHTKIILGVFGVLLIGYIINAIDRTSFPVFITDIRREYGFNLSDAGLISTVSYLGVGLTGFPVGYLIGRFSRKHMFNVGLLLFSAATILTIYSFSYWDMLIYRILTGVGESLQLTALFTIAGVLFSRYRGAAVGAVNTSFAIGSFIGPYVGGVLLASYNSWRVPMVVFGIVGFIAFVATILLPARITDRKIEHNEPTHTVTGGATTAHNRNTYLLIPATALGGLVTFGFLGMYPTFLQEQLGYSGETAGFLLSLSGIGALASLFGGFLGDRLNPRTVLVGAYLGTAVVGVIMFAGPTDEVSQAILSFAMGVVFSGVVYVNLAGCVVKSVTQRLAGAASGIFMTSMYVPAAFAGFTIGSMASAWSWSTAGIIQISVFSVVGAILCALLKPQTFSRHRTTTQPASTAAQAPVTP